MGSKGKIPAQVPNVAFISFSLGRLLISHVSLLHQFLLYEAQIKTAQCRSIFDGTAYCEPCINGHFLMRIIIMIYLYIWHNFKLLTSINFLLRKNLFSFHFHSTELKIWSLFFWLRFQNLGLSLRVWNSWTLTPWKHIE